MSARLPGRTLPLRRWLALALASVFVIPFLITATVAFHVVGEPPADATEPAAERLREDVSRWTDPTWQAETRDALAAKGVSFAAA